MSFATWERLGVMPPGRTAYWRGHLNPVELAAADRIRLWLCIDALAGQIPAGCRPGMVGPLPEDESHSDDLQEWLSSRLPKKVRLLWFKKIDDSKGNT